MNKKQKKGFVIWITGLSGSGKTTLAKKFFTTYKNDFKNLIFLDGDNLREIFFSSEEKDRSYLKKDRLETAYKYSKLCKLLSDQGANVIIATISMFQEIYTWNSNNIENYCEIFLDIPLEVLSQRDTKQLYSSYYHGKTKNVVGLDITFDKPIRPQLVIDYDMQKKNDTYGENLIFDILVKKGLT